MSVLLQGTKDPAPTLPSMLVKKRQTGWTWTGLSRQTSSSDKSCDDQSVNWQLRPLFVLINKLVVPVDEANETMKGFFMPSIATDLQAPHKVLEWANKWTLPLRHWTSFTRAARVTVLLFSFTTLPCGNCMQGTRTQTHTSTYIQDTPPKIITMYCRMKWHEERECP